MTFKHNKYLYHCPSLHCNANAEVLLIKMLGHMCMAHSFQCHLTHEVHFPFSSLLYMWPLINFYSILALTLSSFPHFAHVLFLFFNISTYSFDVRTLTTVIRLVGPLAEASSTSRSCMNISCGAETNIRMEHVETLRYMCICAMYIVLTCIIVASM